MNRTTYLYILLASTILIWGFSFVVVKVAIDDGSPPVQIAMGRFLVASLIFGSFLLWKRPGWPARSDLRTFFILAFLGVGSYYVFQYYSVKYAGPSVTAILVTLLCPIMIFIMSRFKLNESVSRAQTVGLGIATLGAFLVITDGSLAFISNSAQIVGGIFGVICALFWAIYTVEGKKIVIKYDPFVSTAYLSLIGTAMLVPLALAEYQISENVEFHLSYLAAILFLGIMCTVIGYVFWFRALTGLTASSTGATLYFEPVVTIIFAYAILGQGIGWIAGLGGVLVLVGVAVVSRR